MMNKINNYECVSCSYATNRKSNFSKHLLTKRHLQNNNFDNKCIVKKLFQCLCGKEYKYKSGYSRHKCNKKNNSEDISVITQLQFQQLQSQILDLTKICVQNSTLITNIHHNNIHHHNNNNNTFNNPTFNLNLFLTETCKDAMNIKDFINSICISIDDLQRIGHDGYIAGLSTMINQHLNNLDITKRPLHCSDIKRETMYIKENDVWEKDDEQKMKLQSVVKEISQMNVKAIQKYKTKYPDCNLQTSNKNNEYENIVHECFGGKTQNMDHARLKIINRIANNVKLSKNELSTCL